MAKLQLSSGAGGFWVLVRSGEGEVFTWESSALGQGEVKQGADGLRFHAPRVGGWVLEGLPLGQMSLPCLLWVILIVTGCL